MKILLISGSYPYFKDGISDGARILKKYISKKHKVDLITTDMDEIRSYIQESKEENVNYIKCWKIKGLKKYMEDILQNTYDIIHIEYPGNGYKKELGICLLPYILRIIRRQKKYKYKIIMRLHEYTQARTLRKIVINPMIKYVDRVYIPSSVDFEFLEKKWGEKIRKTLIGSNIDVKSLKSDFKDEILNISYFGYIYPNKGFERVLNILSLLSKRKPDLKFCFTIIGEFSAESGRFKEYHRDLQNIIQELGLKDKITSTGYLDEDSVSEMLAKADIALLPYNDGLTLRRGSFIAYLQHGVPIITTEGDGESKHIFNNVSGVFMCATDEEIIDSIVSISKMDNTQINKMSMDNIKIGEMFNWDNIVNKLLQEYGEYYETK